MEETLSVSHILSRHRTKHISMPQARALLRTDDEVRIGGYIATLESLGIQFVAVSG